MPAPLTFAQAGMRGWRLVIRCDRCNREEELPLPLDKSSKVPLGEWADFAIEDVWKAEKFRCRQCGGKASHLSVQRLLKSGRRWSPVMTLRGAG